MVSMLTTACDQHASRESIPRVATGTDRVRAVYPNHGYGATVALSADETVAYMASFYGLYAYSTVTDEPLWHNPSAGTQDPSTGPTVDSDGTIYVGNQTGMHAVNPDGTTIATKAIVNKEISRHSSAKSVCSHPLRFQAA